MSKTLHTGYTLDAEGHKTIYYVDDIDQLSCEIRNYRVVEFKDWSWTGFLANAMSGEKRGLRYNIQIGDLFYETLDE